jgi:hypothetical protein
MGLPVVATVSFGEPPSHRRRTARARAFSPPTLFPSPLCRYTQAEARRRRRQNTCRFSSSAIAAQSVGAATFSCRAPACSSTTASATVRVSDELPAASQCSTCSSTGLHCHTVCILISCLPCIPITQPIVPSSVPSLSPSLCTTDGELYCGVDECSFKPPPPSAPPSSGGFGAARASTWVTQARDWLDAGPIISHHLMAAYNHHAFFHHTCRTYAAIRPI